MSEARNITNVRPAPPRASLALDLPTLITTAVEKGLDPTTLQALLTMYNEQQDRQNKEALNAQMADAAGEIAPVLHDAVNKHLGNRYTTHGAYMDMLRPILQPRGVRLGFEAGVLPGEPPAPDGHVRVRIVIGYGGYAERGSYIDEPISRTGSQGGRTQMTEQQAIGSALTYAQRNLLKLTFNLTPAAEEDDDGEASRDGQGSEKAETQRDAARETMTGGNGETGKWKTGLEIALKGVATPDALNAMINGASFVAWRAKATGPQEQEIGKMIAARLADLMAAAAAAKAAAEAKPETGLDNFPDATPPDAPARPHQSVEPLLARIASCQTKVALDSLMMAPEFSRPVSLLTPEDGDRVTAALKARAAEVPAA